MAADTAVFYPLAALILGFGVLVVAARNTVHAVLGLVANFLCVAVLYLLLNAELLAVIQVLVYAGGVVVLYLFVVMLVNLKTAPELALPRASAGVAVALGGALLAELAGMLTYASAGQPPAIAAPPADNTGTIGMVLYTTYLVPFEVASILLLAAMVGAIVLARRQA